MWSSLTLIEDNHQTWTNFPPLHCRAHRTNTNCSPISLRDVTNTSFQTRYNALWCWLKAMMSADELHVTPRLLVGQCGSFSFSGQKERKYVTSLFCSRRHHLTAELIFCSTRSNDALSYESFSLLGPNFTSFHFPSWHDCSVVAVIRIKLVTMVTIISAKHLVC